MYPAAGLSKAVQNSACDAHLLRADLRLHFAPPLTATGAKWMILDVTFELTPDVWRKGVTGRLPSDGAKGE